MEAPQKPVTSQDILHLRSLIWQGLDSLKAPEKNVTWILGRFLIRPFLWGGSWKPTSSGIVGTRFTVPHQQQRFHCQMQRIVVKRLCRAELHRIMCNSEQSIWKAGTGRGRSLAEPIPEPLLRKRQEHAEWQNGAALTAGTGNQRAAAGSKGKAVFFLCIHKQ